MSHTLHPMNRRDFLGTAALAAAGGLVGWASNASGATRAIPANSKVAHACIGVGGMMGGGDFGQFRSHKGTQIVAICDVDKNILERAAKAVPHARRYTDWREMLATEGDKIDSINATVPDHMHAAIALAGIRSGKHVYCQKPLCHDVAECRALADATKKAGVITQLGTQFASGFGDRMGVEYLRRGVIGAVKRIVLCSNRRSGIAYRLVGPRPEPSGLKAPESLAWDLWLGTAPEREFVPKIYHVNKWRAWQDFGTGWSGDIGCHIFDAVWKGLGLTAPLSVSAQVQESWKTSPARRGDTWPQSNHITWIFPGNKLSDGKEIPVEWFDGEFYPDAEAQALAREAGHEKGVPEEAALVIGTEGAMLLPHQSGPVLVPKAKFAEVSRPVVKERRNHYHHFLDTILGKAKCESQFVQTGPMAEAIILGTVAIRLPDTKLTWDAPGLKTDNADANKLLRRSYRKGWEVEL